MPKKGKYLVVSILLIVIVMTIAVAASGTSKNIYNDADKNKIIAKLDGEVISK